LAKDYDKTITRLITTLSKIANNEFPTTKDLAEEFNVSVRTIQNDINKLIVNFPITKTSDHKFKLIDGASLNMSMLNSDEMVLVSLALSQFEDVSDFNKITSRVHKKLVHASFCNPYYVKQEDLQDINIESTTIQTLEDAIQCSNLVRILFDTNEAIVEAYKITNFDGLWYLFGKDDNDGKIKTYMISKIKNLELLPRKHTTSHQHIESILDQTNSAWYEDGNTFEVVIKVDSNIAEYFKEKEFLQSQKIEEIQNNGSLIISFQVSHDEDIDNMIKSWLPNIEVISPVRFRKKIKKELENYLKKLKV